MLPRTRAALGLALFGALLLATPATADASDPGPDRVTWVDHDGRPIPKPPDGEPNFVGHQFREGLVEPLSHAFDIPDKILFVARALGARTRREAVNVNAFDEVPNSTWFTNRNHMRAVPVSDLARGPDSSTAAPAKPWIVKHAKKGGASAGFQIKDADGKKWLLKLDPRDHPQLSAGADMVARTLVHAAGYNVPHNQPVRFTRADLTIDPGLARGAEGELFTEADLDTMLSRGAVFSDGAYSAFASLFLPGHVLGSPSMRRLRPGDSNDWYRHTNRRELRGLYVVCSWIDDWDTKDPQFLDTFLARPDSLGHVAHYLLDVGSSFGAQANGPKALWQGYENTVDFGWIARHFVSLGFAVDPWMRAHENSGIPSVGNFESEVFHPQHFATEQQEAAFREMTDADAYWGAKIVASFSDAQIAAAVGSAHYEDPRATEFLVQNLKERREKITRFWFGRVAPLDFFWMDGGVLRFHDLAQDIGLTGARAYDVKIESEGGRAAPGRLTLSGASIDTQNFGEGASKIELSLSIQGSGARPARVELTRLGSGWIVTRVRHG
ncbi:MAG TPA: hypothetical protein VEU09_00190 [Candidatus Binatia bacterium]|nr:hypothetical protein [Candidatus Binatia bacterium]